MVISLFGLCIISKPNNDIGKKVAKSGDIMTGDLTLWDGIALKLRNEAFGNKMYANLYAQSPEDGPGSVTFYLPNEGWNVIRTLATREWLTGSNMQSSVKAWPGTQLKFSISQGTYVYHFTALGVGVSSGVAACQEGYIINISSGLVNFVSNGAYTASYSGGTLTITLPGNAAYWRYMMVDLSIPFGP